MVAADGTYRVDMPAAASEEVQVLQGGARMVHLHTDKKAAVVYDVAWVGLSPEVASMPAGLLLERATAGMAASDPKARVEPRALAALPEVPAVVVHREGADGGGARLAMVVAQGRLYQLSITARSGTGFPEVDADRFLDSFSLLVSPPPPSPGR